MSKRLFALFFAAVFCAAAMSGCKGDSTASEGNSSSSAPENSGSSTAQVDETYTPTYPYR